MRENRYDDIRKLKMSEKNDHPNFHSSLSEDNLDVPLQRTVGEINRVPFESKNENPQDYDEYNPWS